MGSRTSFFFYIRPSSTNTTSFRTKKPCCVFGGQPASHSPTGEKRRDGGRMDGGDRNRVVLMAHRKYAGGSQEELGQMLLLLSWSTTDCTFPSYPMWFSVASGSSFFVFERKREKLHFLPSAPPIYLFTLALRKVKRVLLVLSLSSPG